MSSENYPVVSFDNISVRNGSRGVPRLVSVSFNVDEGESIVVIGPNGSSKSTLLKVISGELQSDEGMIIFLGDKIKRNSPKEVCSAGGCS